MKLFGRGAPTSTSGPISADDARALRAEADVHWRRRGEESSLRAAIAAWERVVAGDPADVESWRLLTRGRDFLADCLAVRETSDGEAGAGKPRPGLHDAGAAAATSGLAVAADDPELAFWWAQHTILAATTRGVRGVISLVRHNAKVFATMERVAAAAPTTYFGGPDRYFGTLFGAVPAAAGGDLAKSRVHFERSLAIAECFDTYVLFAEVYAKAAGDADLRQRLLRHVVEADPAGIPELEPEQRLAQRKAASALRG